MKIQIEKISIEELKDREKLSNRTVNICSQNNLFNLESILDFYWKKGTFLYLENCGQKSNEELINLCIKFETIIENQEKHTVEDNDLKQVEIDFDDNLVLKQIELLTEIQEKIITYKSSSHLRKLSNRSKNVLSFDSKTLFDFKDFLDIVSNPNYNYKNLYKVGTKSEIELKSYFNMVRELIDETYRIDNSNELIIEFLNSFLVWNFDLSTIEVSKIWNDYDENNGIPIFKTLDYLIFNEILFKSHEGLIFKEGFNFWTNKEVKSLDELSLESEITRERLRQIRNIIYDKFDTKFSFLNLINDKNNKLYGLDMNSDILFVSDELVNEINQVESTSFNRVFIIKIFSILFKDSFELIGYSESTFLPFVKLRGFSNKWKSVYLVNKFILDGFDIEGIVSDIHNRLEIDIEKDYSIVLKDYCLEFEQPNFNIDFDRISHILRIIIKSEFNSKLNVGEFITFKKNTKKQISEYVIEILELYGEPMNINKVYSILNNKNPQKFDSLESLRNSCLRDKNIVSLGKNSLYGLSIWEEEGTIKTGNFYDLTEEYLNQFDTPRHLDDIVVFVSKYRPNVTFKKLHSMLRTKGGKRFSFFKNYHIGLIDMNYGKEFIKNSSIRIETRTWEQSFQSLNEFISIYDRYPSSSMNEEENRLYRFVMVQINKIRKGKLNIDKTERFLKIIDSDKYITRTRRNSKPD